MDPVYDPATHRCVLNGRELISVTRALKDGGVIAPAAQRNYSPEHAERGTRLHDAMYQYFVLKDDPLIKNVDRPYWTQVMHFVESGFNVELAEQMVVDAALGYFGFFDFLGRLRAFTYGYDLLDAKFGTVPASVGPQTMGYRRLLPHPLVRRWALHVTDQKYALKPLNVNARCGMINRLQDVDDEHTFLGALAEAKRRRDREPIPYD